MIKEKASRGNTVRRIESLEMGRLGSGIVDLIEQINIPYLYLPPEIRSRMTDIVRKVILPNLQDATRKGVEPATLKEAISAEKEKMNPDQMGMQEYIELVKRVNIDKINLQNEIAALNFSFLGGEVSEDDFISIGVSLLQRSARIEPVFFASSAQAKKFVAYCMERISIDADGRFSEEELDLLTLPGMPAFYIAFDLDIREWLASTGKDKDRLENKLRRRYYNDDPTFSQSQLNILKTKYFSPRNASERKEVLVQITDIRDYLRSRWVRKVNLLSERKVRFSEYLDQLYLFDDIFDKYFESKLCFLHDLFLKIILVDLAEGKKDHDFSTMEVVESGVRRALFMSDQELFDKLSSA